MQMPFSSLVHRWLAALVPRVAASGLSPRRRAARPREQAKARRPPGAACGRLALLLLTLVLITPADPATAGPWPREPGSGFLAFNSRPSRPMNALRSPPTETYTTLYLEYGLPAAGPLPRDLTAGLDLGRSVSGRGKAIGFLRAPLTGEGASLPAAATLGLGMIDGKGVVRPGLSLGRSLDFGQRGTGWLTLEGFAEWYAKSGETDLKIDLTFGVAHPSGRRSILQLQTGASHDDPPFLRLAPSVVVPLTGGMQLEAGLTVGLSGDDGLGLNLGLWRDF